MKAGLVYALWTVIAVLGIVILFQQRKLANLRQDNASLQTDTRALMSSRHAEVSASADLQRELRQLRIENEQLRRELQQLRIRAAD